MTKLEFIKILLDIDDKVFDLIQAGLVEKV